MADQANLTLARLATCVLLCLASQRVDGDYADNHMHGFLSSLHDDSGAGAAGTRVDFMAFGAVLLSCVHAVPVPADQCSMGAFEEGWLLTYFLLRHSPAYAAYQYAHVDDIEPFVCRVRVRGCSRPTADAAAGRAAPLRARRSLPGAPARVHACVICPSSSPPSCSPSPPTTRPPAACSIWYFYCGGAQC